MTYYSSTSRGISEIFGNFYIKYLMDRERERERDGNFFLGNYFKISKYG